MLIQTIKSEIVSHLSYIIGSKNEAAVIDPRRDCQVYLDIANQWGAKIKYVFETHRNEDYVTGSLELTNLTSSTIFHGPGLSWGFGEVIQHNKEIEMELLKIRALHTPGHSPESMSYVLYDLESGGQPVVVFTGDTLFVGDVGRTDFLGEQMTPVMSEKLFDSITKKLLPLGDSVIVCPAHGAGSVCGGKISQREISTIGIEKKTNPMLNLSKKEFVTQKTAEQQSPAAQRFTFWLRRACLSLLLSFLFTFIFIVFLSAFRFAFRFAFPDSSLFVKAPAIWCQK